MIAGLYPKLAGGQEVRQAKRRDLLDEVERRACLYFLEKANPETGLVLDRAPANGGRGGNVASIAATGFGLTALGIGSARGFIRPAEARQRVEKTLDYLANGLWNNHGFFYHFVDAGTGERALNCEVSSVDTAWLLCGVIHARQYFASSLIERLANQVVDRVDWQWMLNGKETLCHGWNPAFGFLPYQWDSYSELLAMYLLAMGSSESPIPSTSWHAWDRPKTTELGRPYIESVAPLFVHQYSHGWLDFRRRRDEYADYFENSLLATARHRRFCLSMRERFPWFDEQMWGITASDSRYGYLDWGGPGTKANAKIDGTLVPCAPGGSVAFLPNECTAVLEKMLARYGKKVWSRYGFIDAFNPNTDWWCPDVLGIDLGIMLLAAENARTGSVWSVMMSAPEVRRGFSAAGFRS